MKGNTLRQLKKWYGKPILRFSPKGEFTESEILNNGIPKECLVFRISHPSEYIIFSKYNDNKWYGNIGERYVVRELLERLRYI